VEIEVYAGWRNTDKIAVVGLLDTAVKESKDRVTSAICNSGLRWPYGQRITINLAPADVRKEGPSDPSDLVLDPTCGSGTTATVAEQWGRRWITIDISRMDLALARPGSWVRGLRFNCWPTPAMAE
jgi:hypothetical protein